MVSINYKKQNKISFVNWVDKAWDVILSKKKHQEWVQGYKDLA